MGSNFTRRYRVNKLSLGLLIFIISVNIFSCSSVKSVKYFQDLPDSGAQKSFQGANYVEPKVQVDDILAVNIQIVDASVVQNQTINQGNTTALNYGGSVPGAVSASGQGGAGQSQGASGYLVNKDGYIDVPVLGRIKVVGYTTTQLTVMIKEIADKYYTNPTVSVRYGNFRVNIAGEVSKPGVYVMNNEKVGLLDVLSMAGDLTIYGKRENVLLIRTNADGTKTPHRFNLKRSDIISDPYYYLQQNDYIYVQPGTSKAAATDAAQARNYTIIGSVLSLLTIYLTRK